MTTAAYRLEPSERDYLPEPLYLTRDQAAHLVQVHPTTIDDWARRYRNPTEPGDKKFPISHNHRNTRIPRLAFLEWVDWYYFQRKEVAPAPPAPTKRRGRPPKRPRS